MRLRVAIRQVREGGVGSGTFRVRVSPPVRRLGLGFLDRVDFFLILIFWLFVPFLFFPL